LVGRCTAGLIDEDRLIVFPVVVGTGKKLFADGCVPLSLRLVESSGTSAGAVACTLRPTAAPVGGQTFGLVDGQEAVLDAR